MFHVGMSHVSCRNKSCLTQEETMRKTSASCMEEHTHTQTYTHTHRRTHTHDDLHVMKKHEHHKTFRVKMGTKPL